MAVVYPAFENILRSKQKLEDGELYLLESLAKSLPADVEIFFQPFVEGDRPDIILLQKDVGLTIIEVKDWNLNLYDARTGKDWNIKSNGKIIRSPLQQLDTYRRNFFEIYVNDILITQVSHLDIVR
ncbi:conserved hypothetical protein [Denitrovibrio acetiphilus DSM 12809]|uniref:NERD domain-containing protein n=1 Tax=Denitrovibrio acetiphilus (strain DSM 12809 / NBRC 114555 / N2460) TaxID=522772 RepID=D4H4R4_DENA2|nr:NERD domain-containing protein [Denitrovibrio acetiphilus]ADD67458.1 conserved hypothetical protein [Denitrovibrio acetiphilus DSM 12809]